MKLLNKKLTIIILIFSSLCIYSFTFIRTNKVGVDGQKVTIAGKVYVHVPYGGGASPPPEIARGSFYDSKHTELHFVLKNDSSKTSIAKFTTDSLGGFSIDMHPNEYLIFQSQKMVPLDSLYGINFKDTTHSAVGEISCLKRWHNSPDLYLKVTKDTFIQIILPSSHPCFQRDELDRP